jgi:hypothetical protein
MFVYVLELCKSEAKRASGQFLTFAQFTERTAYSGRGFFVFSIIDKWISE